ncbi:helical backbone metal receptor [Deinococcus peraridilitoris]|uniref:ABC-type Fe3+-hydroxamate transport system, periplasmic component n=1 Tax=Deinococcus peraridilitoris (strain DSM 19664 / LMG 22246 / CIP 109416 / KR-200) TaxID=937777 RepID=K9ZX24_DEIPD|nr:helical backbone metal receptor [Deinococcus peraridilitoris]AFZ65739.1 ABC-type Fe3+-hydroxamate transport system, periplasmic component [Deinococcus peraridilitoris DSM 19664]
MRLASLTCSNTEILVALGLHPSLVAVDSHSDAPEVAHLPRLGPDLNIDVDALATFRPDLVLSSLSVPGMEQVVARVEAAGLRQLILDPQGWPDVLRDIEEVGAALNASGRARQVVRTLQDEVRLLQRPGVRRLRVAVEWWPRPIIVAGRLSWVTDMLQDLGAQNAFADREVRSTPVSRADWQSAAPDLIVVSWCGVRRLRPEVVEARGLGVPVVCIPESGLGRPGPRLIEGYRALAHALDTLGN